MFKYDVGVADVGTFVDLVGAGFLELPEKDEMRFNEDLMILFF